MANAPHRIVFANEKGGTGKSTTAVHVAVALAYRGARVAAIDLDPRQRTLYRYFENRAETERRRDIELPGAQFAVFESGSVEELEATVETLTQGDLAGPADFVIFDTPGRDDPLPRDGFYAWLDMVIAMRGEDLLRVKGIVHLAEQPERPLVFHGVQHLYQPPVSLPAWPSPDRRTRIVFITRGVDAEAMDESLRVFERRRRQRPAAAASPDPSSKPKETP